MKTGVITNGSILWKKDVLYDLMNAETVNITLSAGTDETFRKLHRPFKSLSIEKVFEGMKSFASAFKGELWIEVMLVKGINSGEDEMKKIKKLISKLNPHKVFVMTPTRPPAETDVFSPDRQTIEKALQLFDGIDASVPEDGGFGISALETAADEIIGICKRHPLRLEQARQIENSRGKDVVKILERRGIVERVRYGEYIFLEYIPNKKNVGKIKK